MKVKKIMRKVFDFVDSRSYREIDYIYNYKGAR